MNTIAMQRQAHIPRRGRYDLEPGVWQMVSIPSRLGAWDDSPAGSGAIFVDTFTGVNGTALDAEGRMPDSGPPWVPLWGVPCTIQDNSAYGGGALGQEEGANQTDGTFSSYSVGCTAVFGLKRIGVSETTSHELSVFFGQDDYTSHVGSRCLFRAHTSPFLTLYDVVSGAAPQVSLVDVLPADGSTVEVRLVVEPTKVTVHIGGGALMVTADYDSGYLPQVFPCRFAIHQQPNGEKGFQVLGFEVFDQVLGATEPLPVSEEVVGLVRGTARAKIKQYVIDQLESKYGAGCVTVANTYPGDLNRFLSFVPGSTPEASEHNFELMYEEEDGSFEPTAFWIKSNYGSPMVLDFVEWR